MMEWFVLAFILSFPSLTQADCSSQCLKCAQQIPSLDTEVNRLTCTLECEGTLVTTSLLDKCEKALQELGNGLTELKQDYEDVQSTSKVKDPEEPWVASLVKRYGGFIKRIDKNKISTSPWNENTYLKGFFAKKYGEPYRKFGERDVSELSEDSEREDVTSENDQTLFDDTALNEVKRYGGFLRKFGPKRGNLIDDSSRQDLQKRYGGFMRRIRPKLKWDNQKRYGGFLRRHFKISVRSEDEPNLFDEFGL
ncbi:proenkephalin-B [Chanos chanos]|uniref:Proenkephalin-B n=1 Tax=Chanos chanos TaxID=29144 RepID=A0A6J2W5N4_CHACN|nr:proenkephalin-B [Chanos chanos]